jgi:hypothetical protein
MLRSYIAQLLTEFAQIRLRWYLSLYERSVTFLYWSDKTEACRKFMESTNQRPSYLINMCEIRCFSNQVENFPIWRDGENVVATEVKWTLEQEHVQSVCGVKSIVYTDSRPLDTIKLALAQDNIVFIHDKGIGLIKYIYKQWNNNWWSGFVLLKGNSVVTTHALIHAWPYIRPIICTADRWSNTPLQPLR